MILTNKALVQRIESAYVKEMVDFAMTHATVNPDAGAAVMPVAGGQAVFAGAGLPHNRAIGLGLTGPVTAADLDQVEAFYLAHGVPSQIDISPFTDPSLCSLLGQRGYRITGFDNVHIRLITPDERLPDPDPAIRVTQVGPAEREAWALTVGSGFAGQELPAPDQIAPTVLQQQNVTCFLARVNGQPAGAGALAFMNDGVAFFSSGSTRRDFRRCGVQTALLTERLRAAAAAGCDLAIVHTEPASNSERNIRRAGFETVYTILSLVRNLQ